MNDISESKTQTSSEAPKTKLTNSFNQKGGMLWNGLIESGVIQHLNGDDLKVLIYYVTMGRGYSTRIDERQQEIADKLGLTSPRVSRAVKRLCELPDYLGLNDKMPPILFDEERHRRESKKSGRTEKSDSTETSPGDDSETRRKSLRCSIHPFWGHKGSQKSYQMRWNLYYPGNAMQSSAIKRRHSIIRKALQDKKDKSP